MVFVKIVDKLDGEYLPTRFVEFENSKDANAFIEKDLYETIADSIGIEREKIEEAKENGFLDEFDVDKEYGIRFSTESYIGHKPNIADAYIDWQDGLNMKMYYFVYTQNSRFEK